MASASFALDLARYRRICPAEIRCRCFRSPRGNAWPGNSQPVRYNRQVTMYLAKPVGGWTNTVIGRFDNGQVIEMCLLKRSKIDSIARQEPTDQAKLLNLLNGKGGIRTHDDLRKSASCRFYVARQAKDAVDHCTLLHAHHCFEDRPIISDATEDAAVLPIDAVLNPKKELCHRAGVPDKVEIAGRFESVIHDARAVPLCSFRLRGIDWLNSFSGPLAGVLPQAIGPRKCDNHSIARQTASGVGMCPL